MDKGFDFPEVDYLVVEHGYTAHIARRSVDQSKRKRIPGYRARRWVVERPKSWDEQIQAPPNQVGEEKENYMAMLHFACAWITCKQAGIIG